MKFNKKNPQKTLFFSVSKFMKNFILTKKKYRTSTSDWGVVAQFLHILLIMFVCLARLEEQESVTTEYLVKTSTAI
jgi:hypothetical protein